MGPEVPLRQCGPSLLVLSCVGGWSNPDWLGAKVLVFLPSGPLLEIELLSWARQDENVRSYASPGSKIYLSHPKPEKFLFSLRKIPLVFLKGSLSLASHSRTPLQFHGGIEAFGNKLL